MRGPFLLLALALGLVVLLGLSLEVRAETASPAYSVVTFTGMIPPSPQNNAGWYMLLDEYGGTTTRNALGTGHDFNLSADSASGLWVKVRLEWSDQVNVTLTTTTGHVINLGFNRIVTGEWLPMGTPSDYIETWSDLGGGFSGISNQLSGEEWVSIRYVKSYLTNQTGIEVRVGNSGADYVIPVGSSSDVISNAVITSGTLINVVALNTKTVYIQSAASGGGSNPTTGSTDIAGFVSQAIESLVSIANVVIVVITVGFGLFKIIVIDHGITTILLLEMGGMFFALNKYKGKRAGLASAIGEWLSMNRSMIEATISFTSWAISALTNIISGLSVAIQAGITLGSNLLQAGILLLKAIL